MESQTSHSGISLSLGTSPQPWFFKLQYHGPRFCEVTCAGRWPPGPRPVTLTQRAVAQAQLPLPEAAHSASRPDRLDRVRKLGFALLPGIYQADQPSQGQCCVQGGEEEPQAGFHPSAAQPCACRVGRALGGALWAASARPLVLHCDTVTLANWLGGGVGWGVEEPTRPRGPQHTYRS